ncbi:MAG: esterase/lipase family protein [Vibrio sp.]
MSNQPTIIKMYPEFDRYGQPVYKHPAYHKDDNIIVRYMQFPEKVVPIVFLPGVMGSNLKNSDKKPVWNLSSNAGLLKKWLFKSAESRKNLLSPTSTQVDSSGDVDDDNKEDAIFKGNSKLFGTRTERGWGSVGYGSYYEFLDWLQTALHDFMDAEEGVSLRRELAGINLGAEFNEQALTYEEALHSYDYFFPVHAVGYNWLQSNKDSAKYVSEQVDSIIYHYQKRLGKKCHKVILVTHSMGGLVARHYTQNLGGESKVLGVVHGVMPANGAPAVYRRMKAGTEYTSLWNLPSFLSAKVLGGNAATMTAVLSQSPGPIQLLPGEAYGMNWLEIENGRYSYTLPKRDPYEEIYLNRDTWWGLCETPLINAEQSKTQAALDKDWENYSKMMKKTVKSFIEGLNGQYHPLTYSFYGDSESYLSFGKVRWEDCTNFYHQGYLNNNDYLSDSLTKPTFTDEQVLAGKLHSRDEQHDLRTVSIPTDTREIKRDYKITSPSSAGDGTVPLASGQIHTRYLQSRLAVQVEHEPAFNQKSDSPNSNLKALNPDRALNVVHYDESASGYASIDKRASLEEVSIARLFTLRAILKLVQQLD